MRHLFTAGCTCDTAAVIRAHLEGKRPPRCPAHEADQLDQDEVEDARTTARAEADRLTDLHRQLDAEDQATDAARVADLDARRRERGLRDLASVDPLASAVARAVGAPVPPLNAPTSAYPALAGLTEADPTTPLDAA